MFTSAINLWRRWTALQKASKVKKNSARSLVGLNRDCSRDDLKYENKFKNGVFFSLENRYARYIWSPTEYHTWIYFTVISGGDVTFDDTCHIIMWPFSQVKRKIQLTILLTGVDLRGLKTVLILFLSRMIVLNGTNDFDMMFRLCDFYYFGAFLCW